LAAERTSTAEDDGHVKVLFRLTGVAERLVNLPRSLCIQIHLAAWLANLDLDIPDQNAAVLVSGHVVNSLESDGPFAEGTGFHFLNNSPERVRGSVRSCLVS